MSTVKITIKTNPKWKPVRPALAAGLQISVIGIGVLVGSAAMQWAGFLLLALLMIVVATTQQKVTDLTIAEARAKLDEIEANEDTTQ